MKVKKLQEELKTLEQQTLEIENRKREILSILEEMSRSQEEESKEIFIKNVLNDFFEMFATQNISLYYKDVFCLLFATDTTNGNIIGSIQTEDLTLVRPYLSKQFLTYPLYKFLTGFFHGKENVKIEWGKEFDYDILFQPSKDDDENEELRIFATYLPDSQEISVKIQKGSYGLSDIELRPTDNEELSIFAEGKLDSFTMLYNYKFTANWTTLPAMLQHSIDRIQQFPQNDSRFSILEPICNT